MLTIQRLQLIMLMLLLRNLKRNSYDNRRKSKRVSQ